MATDYGSGGSYSVRMAGPFGSAGVSAEKITTISAPAANWKGAESPYSQEVSVRGISVASKVDIQLAPEQMEAFRDMDIAFTVGNEEGVATLYAIGDKPTADLTFQATISEVVSV